jgi:hypothetical protein
MSINIIDNLYFLLHTQDNILQNILLVSLNLKIINLKKNYKLNSSILSYSTEIKNKNQNSNCNYDHGIKGLEHVSSQFLN